MFGRTIGRTIVQMIGALAGATAAVYLLVAAQAWLEAIVIATLSLGGLYNWWRTRQLGPSEWSERMMGWLIAAILGFLVVADELKDSRGEQAAHPDCKGADASVSSTDITPARR